MAHDIFHVVALISFLAAMGVAFIGVAAPALFEQAERAGLPRFRTSLLLGLAAVGGLAADWLLHKILS